MFDLFPSNFLQATKRYVKYSTLLSSALDETTKKFQMNDEAFIVNGKDNGQMSGARICVPISLYKL